MRGQGIKLDPEEQRRLAIRAYELSLMKPPYSREAIGFELDVSTPTARNLVLYGARIAQGREDPE